MRKTIDILLSAVALWALASCSTTSNLPDDDMLYTGMKKTQYVVADSDANFDNVKDEVEAALACKPNGSLLGSPYYRSPLQIKLAVFNKYANADSKFGRWMRDKFGSAPVLLSYVAPETRALVAKNLLRANGYFDAQVAYGIIPQKNPKKAKLSYIVTPGKLYTIDTVKYVGYEPAADSLIHATAAQSGLKPGKPFTTAALDAERSRLATLFRNNGYYFYSAGHAVFVADSVSNPGKVEVHVQPAGGMPELAKRKWYLGRLRVNLRRDMGEQLTDSFVHRYLSIYFAGRSVGKKIPIRPGAVLRDVKLRPRQLFSQDAYMESANNVNSLGMFSLADFSFAPRDTTANCDTLDMTLNCVLDKPYDGSIEANYSLKSNDRTGPGLVLGLTKRNAFRGAEKLTVNLKGSYEWQTGRKVDGNSSKINSYEYGADVSIEYPRLETPFKLFRRHRFASTPSTLFSLSGNVLNRADYFKMLTVTGAVTYKFQTSPNSMHEFSPFLLDYTMLNHTTEAFDSIMDANPAIYVSMRNQFVPKIKYTYTYTSPASYRNPVAWELSLTESGNLLSLGYMAAGKKFNDKEKDLFGNSFAQFVKVSTSLRKTWSLGYKSQLVGHVAAGVLYAYGNSVRGPYSEQFYVGGANSIRAFTIRSIGPGKYVAPSSTYSYLDQTGDIKLEMNLEYRFNIFGSLYGALFFDAGNIWLMKKDENRPDAEFRFDTFWRQLATGTGLGVRYDLDFFVLRLDLGIALHVPYDTGKSGYYNIPKFSDGLGVHFAIGYPF